MLTIVSGFYKIKSKFEDKRYYEWMSNMLENIERANMVIYTDSENYEIIKEMRKGKEEKTKIIIKEITDFYVNKYKNEFIENNIKNIYIKNVDYRLNMIWNEKINFVKETIEKKYFETDFYCWCDIGYFRCNDDNIKKDEIKLFPNNQKITTLNTEKIYYGLVNDNIKELYNIINDRDNNDMTKIEIPHNQVSIAGGFFIGHKNKIIQWHKIYYDLLDKYIKQNRLIKDDQIIIIDCILNKKYANNFKLIKNKLKNFDDWFVFSKYLL
jgi:hypothetical protein